MSIFFAGIKKSEIVDSDLDLTVIQNDDEGESQKEEAMSTKKTATKKAASKKPTDDRKNAITHISIFGRRITEFMHWLRDHKYTLAQARHILKKKGFKIITTGPVDSKTVRDNTIRPHLNCFPKFCKKKAEKFEPKIVSEIEAIVKAMPKEDVAPKTKKVAKAKRSASKATKKDASAPKKTPKNMTPRWDKAKAAPKTPKAPKVAAPKKVKTKTASKPKDAPATTMTAPATE
jgi:hypothetical protein